MSEENVNTNTSVKKGSRRSVHDIIEEAGAKGSKHVMGYLDTLDELREKRELADGTYKADLSAEQQAQVLMREKLEQAQDARETAKERYTEHLNKTHAALNNRREELRESLYSIKNPEVLTRVLLSSDDELRQLAEAAVQTRESELTRACLVAAERRGAGDVLSTIFGTDPGLQEA